MRLRTLMMTPLLLLGACSPPGPGNAEEPAQSTRSVIVQRIQPQPLDVTIRLPVNIRPREVIELRAPAPGTIRHLTYEKGDVIPASTLPSAEWIEAQSFVEAFAEGEAPTDEQLALRNLRHLDGFESFARIDSSQLRESFWEAQVSYDQAVRDLQRTEEYAQSTGAQLDQARTRKSMARANVQRILAMIHDSYVCSPVEGMLVEKVRQEGEYVNGGELIGEVAIMKTLVADLEIPEAHRSKLEVGTEIEIVIGSLKDTAGNPIKRMGKVAMIDSVAHPSTHSFTVELIIDNADLALPAGVFGTVNVVVYSKPDALVVPLSALKLNGPRKSLFVVNGAEAEGSVKELANVEIGNLTQDWVEIRGNTLKPGMLVVTFGAQALSDGDAVNWTEKDPYVVKGGEQ